MKNLAFLFLFSSFVHAQVDTQALKPLTNVAEAVSSGEARESIRKFNLADCPPQEAEKPFILVPQDVMALKRVITHGATKPGPGNTVAVYGPVTVIEAPGTVATYEQLQQPQGDGGGVKLEMTIVDPVSQTSSVVKFKGDKVRLQNDFRFGENVESSVSVEVDYRGRAMLTLSMKP